MKGKLLILASVTVLLPVRAQEGTPVVPKTVVTEKILGQSGSPALYEVSPSGEVWIDWRAVEAMATAPTDRVNQPLAAMMLSVRDRTWKDFSQRK